MDFQKDHWNKANICKLIELYRESVELWNTRSPLYKLKNKKHDAWMGIAEAMNMEKTEVEKKMRCLIGQFQREEKKCKSMEKSGAGLDEIYISKWFAFKLLMFLKDKNKPGETIEAGIEKAHETEESDALTESEIEVHERESIPADGTATISQATEAVNKRSKRVSTSTNRRSEEAYAVLKSLQQNVHKRDEYDAFGKLVAAKVRKLDEDTRDDVMLQINQLLVKVRQGRSQHQYQEPLAIKIPQNQNSLFSPPNVHSNSSTSNSSYSCVEHPFSSPSTYQSISSYIPNQFSQPLSPFNLLSLSQPISSSSFIDNQSIQSSNSDLSNTVRNYFETFNDIIE